MTSTNTNLLYFSYLREGKYLQFNEYLKQCREENHLTQEQLVSELYTHDIEQFGGLDARALSKWEKSVIKPKVAKQVSIIKYFQKRTGVPLPCWSHYSVDEAEELICKAGMRNIIGKNKSFVCNFPSELMNVDDMKVYPVRNFQRMDALIESNMHIHQNFNHKFTQISREQFREWALHPSNLFLACEYKDSFLGFFFTARVRPEIFDKILNFKMKKSEITTSDFASFDEIGSHLLLSFYAMNMKAATMLTVRYYAHLIANQKNIDEIGGVTTNDDAKKIASNMNLHYHSSYTTNDNIKIKSYRQTLANVLASENAVKMFLVKQECPEE